MAKNLIVSLSPHVHGRDSVQRNMYGVCIALIPALLTSLYFFGLGAAIVLATSVAACVFFAALSGRDPRTLDGIPDIAPDTAATLRSIARDTLQGSTKEDFACATY